MSTAKVPPGVASMSACWPIHACSPSRVTRWSKTMSAGASMSMDVVKSATALRRLLGRGLEGHQPRRPEVLHELAHDVEPLVADDEEVAGALPRLVHQAGAAEHAEVVRHRLLAHGDGDGDVPDGQRSISHDMEDGA